jgi:hypothetical protein
VIVALTNPTESACEIYIYVYIYMYIYVYINNIEGSDPIYFVDNPNVTTVIVALTNSTLSLPIRIRG